MNGELFTDAMGLLPDRLVQEALVYQRFPARSRPARLLRQALVACMVAALLFGTMLVANADLREAVLGWFTEQLGQYTLYHFAGSGQAAKPATREYRLTGAPAGYELVLQDEDGRHFVYSNGSQVLTFRYTHESSDSLYVAEDGAAVLQTTINGKAADFYQSADDSHDNTMVWSSSGVLFLLQGPFDLEELTALAETVEPAPLNYVIGQPPEGYTQTTVNGTAITQMQTWSSDAGQYLHFAANTPEADTLILGVCDCEDYQVRTTTVNGQTADLYLCPRHETILTWSQDGNLLTLQGSLPEQELVAVAESVTLQPYEAEEASPPGVRELAWAPTALPKGYWASGVLRGMHQNSATYRNTAGNVVEFTYFTSRSSRSIWLYVDDYARRELTVQGRAAVLYTREGCASILDWENEYAHFRLEGVLDEDSLLAMAESVAYAAEAQSSAAGYDLTQPPEGYTEMIRQQEEESGLLLLVSTEGNAAQFSYYSGEAHSTVQILHENCTEQSATVHVVPATLYLANDPDASSDLIWTEGDTLFLLSGVFTAEELLAMAESVAPAAENGATALPQSTLEPAETAVVYPQRFELTAPEGYQPQTTRLIYEQSGTVYYRKDRGAVFELFYSDQATLEQRLPDTTAYTQVQTEVNGQPAVICTPSDEHYALNLIWRQDGTLLELSSTHHTAEELLALARTVRQTEIWPTGYCPDQTAE